MNKKKYITIPIVLIITILYVTKVYCLNKDYPQKDYIESVNMNEEILCQDFDIRVVDARIVSIDPSGFPIAVISYDIKNTSNKKWIYLIFMTSCHCIQIMTKETYKI